MLTVRGLNWLRYAYAVVLVLISAANMEFSIDGAAKLVIAYVLFFNFYSGLGGGVVYTPVGEIKKRNERGDIDPSWALNVIIGFIAPAIILYKF